MTTTADYHCFFSTADIQAGAVRVRALTIDEAMSEECTCVVELVCDHAVFDLRGLPGVAGTVTIARSDGTIVRWVHGVVRAVRERAGTTPDRLEFSVVMASALSILHDSSDSKIFQDQTAREVVSLVMQHQGISEEVVEWRTATQTRRKTCTQHQESARAFVDRVLEHEGVCWFIEHRHDGPRVVFADSPSGYSELGDPPLLFNDAQGMNGDEFVRGSSISTRVRPKKVTLCDHDFNKPALKLEAQVEGSGPLGREHYEYPGRQLETSALRARAQAVSDAVEAAALQTHLQGSAIRVSPGHVFALQGTPAAKTDGKFVAVRARHRWTPTANGPSILTSDLWLIKADRRFVPVPRTPVPRPVGALALVTTPSGEDIHTNQHGQVKVLYKWDRHNEQDDTSSGWSRVGQLHTSGSVVIPRKGWEVLVEYEHGDLERPCVMGRLYNAANPPVDSLPANKSNSVLSSYGSPGRKGHNEIRMNDGGGGELVQVHAEKDLNLVVANDKEEKVATMATVAVSVNQTVSVGADQTESVGAAENVTVGGSQTHKVGASRTKTVSSDEKIDVGGDRSLTIGGGHTTMTPMSDSTSTSSSLSETVSGMCLEAAALGVGLAVAGTTSISVGGAKIEAVATGKNDMTIGARASTVGGAFVNVTPKDIAFTTTGIKVTTVGGAWLANAGGDVDLSTQGSLSITVGGALAMTAAKIVLKVGSSNVTISGGQVILESSQITIKASGPASELSAGVASK